MNQYGHKEKIQRTSIIPGWKSKKISIVRDNFSREKRKYTENRNDLCDDFEQDMIWEKLYFVKL